MEKVLIIEPVFKETIWGGTKLKKEFSYETPSNHTGECWGISGHPNGDCRIKNMPGYTISSLWRDYHDILSDNPSPVFPILIKLIDANSDLSIQVHPDDAYAKIHENSLGKHECWYILPSDPEAKLVIGHKAQTKEELVSMIEHHQFDDLLNVVDVRSGDFFDIPPGTVHAIKAGCLLYESQQSSDITYRLYDYDRRDASNQLRPLHIKQALDVITVPQNVSRVELVDNFLGEHCLTTEFFSVDHVIVREHLSFSNKNMLLCTVIQGSGEACGYSVKKGDHFIIPKATDEVIFSGNFEMMVTSS